MISDALIREAAREAASIAAAPAEWPEAPDLPGPPPLDPLPLHELPAAIRDHAESVAAATQTPPDLAGLLALTCVSAALQGRAEVEVDARGWTEPVMIYSTAILPPASRKSPVYRLMTAPLLEWEAEERERIGPDHRRAMDRVEIAAAGLAHAKGAAAKGKATPDEVDAAREALEAAERAVPRLPRLFVADATPEALVRIMAEQGGRIALLAPEGDPLRIMDGRYSEGAARLGELKQAWSGEALTVDRIGRESIHIPRPALTMGLTMQPGVLDTLKNARTMRDEGLLGRILWCVPAHGLGGRLTGRDVPPLDTAAAARYGRALRAIVQAADALEEPRRLQLAPAALEVLYSYEAEIERELGDGERLAGIRDWAGKVCGQAIRLAALLDLASRAGEGRPLWSDPVAPWAMEGAVALARALTTHALAVMTEVGADRRAALAGYVLRRALELPEGSTLRDLFDVARRKTGLEDMEALRVVVDGLIARGCMRLASQERDGPGRPASPLIEIHPAILNSSPQYPHNTPAHPENGNSADIADTNPGAALEAEELELTAWTGTL